MIILFLFSFLFFSKFDLMLEDLSDLAHGEID